MTNSTTRRKEANTGTKWSSSCQLLATWSQYRRKDEGRRARGSKNSAQSSPTSSWLRVSDLEETVAASWANAEGSRKAVISSPLTNSLTGCNGSSPLALGDPVPEDGEVGTLPPSLAAVTGTTTVEMVDAGADGVVEEEMVVSSTQLLNGERPAEEADTLATHRLQASHKIM